MTDSTTTVAMTPDPIQDILETFVDATQRLMSSPADYQQAEQWVEAGIPVTVVQAVITDALKDKPLRKRQGFRLTWLDPQVQEEYIGWRRRVGPWSRVQ